MIFLKCYTWPPFSFAVVYFPHSLLLLSEWQLHVSSASKCAAPPYLGGHPWPSVPPWPSNGRPSPWLPDTKSTVISASGVSISRKFMCAWELQAWRLGEQCGGLIVSLHGTKVKSFPPLVSFELIGANVTGGPAGIKSCDADSDKLKGQLSGKTLKQAIVCCSEDTYDSYGCDDVGLGWKIRDSTEG